jgi:hypothetical protein
MQPNEIAKEIDKLDLSEWQNPSWINATVLTNRACCKHTTVTMFTQKFAIGKTLNDHCNAEKFLPNQPKM